MSINIEEFKDLTVKEIEEKIESLTNEEIHSLTIEERKAISALKRSKEKQEAKVKIPKLKARGEKLIYPERKAEWNDFVKNFTDGRFIFALEDTIKAMEALAEGKSVDELYKEVDDTDALIYCCNDIITFSKRGPEFGRYMIENAGVYGFGWKGHVEWIEKENEILAKNEIERKIETVKPGATISTETTAEPVPTKDNKKED